MKDKKHRSSEINFTQGNILLQLISFAIPLLLGDLLQQFYNLADSVIVGRFVGKEALAAVGSTGPLINTIIGLFLGCSVGAGVLISQKYGAKDEEGVFRAIHTTAALAIVFGVCFTFIGVVSAPLLLRWMSTPADVFETALLYLRVYFSGISGLILYNMCGGILRAFGDSKRPIQALTISTISNIVLDIIFVVVFRWGVVGVAAATVLAQLGSAVYLACLLCSGKAKYKLQLARIHIHKASVRAILGVGIPLGLQRMVTAMSNTIVQSYINAFGSSCMAGWAVYNKVHQLAVLPMENLGTATMTFVGQNYGAKNWTRIKRGVKTAAGLNFVVTLTASVVLYVLAASVTELFSAEKAVVEYGGMFLRQLSLFMPLAILLKTYGNAVRGMGDAKGPMMIMLIGVVASRQLYLLFISNLKYSIRMIAMSYPVGWGVAGVLMVIYYLHVCKKMESSCGCV